MPSFDDTLLAGTSFGTEIEELVFMVGPNAADSQKRLLRVKPHGSGRLSPTASPESAAWGISPADRYFQGRLRRNAGMA